METKKQSEMDELREKLRIAEADRQRLIDEFINIITGYLEKTQGRKE